MAAAQRLFWGHNNMQTEAAIDPRNGLTDEALAASGCGVFMTCHKIKFEWEKADKLTWTMTAGNVVGLIGQARITEVDVPIAHLTMMVYQWATGSNSSGGVPYYDLVETEKLAWEAVARFWANCLNPDNLTPLPQLAAGAVGWYNGKLAAPTTINGNGHQAPKSVVAAPRFTDEDISPPRPAEAKEAKPSPRTGISKSFRTLIDMKINEHQAKISCLISLKERIEPGDCDEALYEIIAPLLEKGE